jgi:outer membrane receptor for ferrienterochelin and colicin
MLTKYLLNAFIFFPFLISAQKASFPISGYVSDAKTGEPLVGATVYESVSKVGRVTNSYGYFALNLIRTSTQIRVSYVGYRDSLVTIQLPHPTPLHLKLSPQSKALGDVEVTGSNTQQGLSSLHLSMAQVKELPVLLGESDLLKAYQLMPGVKAGLEGTSGMYVRGGSPDQNLILLDGAPVYNVSHLFGFFSVFNTDAIKHTELIKGGFPARFGGRLSSVLDVTMKEGNSEKPTAVIGIGLLAAKATIEAPIVKHKASFMLSVRKTYGDVFYNWYKKIFQTDTYEARQGYGFYDLNAKVNYKVNDKNRLFLSHYGGDDLLYSHGQRTSPKDNGTKYDQVDLSLGWGNQTSVLRWTYLPNQSLFGSVLGYYTQFRFKTYIFKLGDFHNLENEHTYHSLDELKLGAHIQDWGLKTDWQYNVKSIHQIRFGIGWLQHRFNPQLNESHIETLKTNVQTSLEAVSIQATEWSAYLEDEIVLSSRFSADIGGHLSAFSVKGKTYTSLQPRLSLVWQPQKAFSMQGTYSTMRQYIHLLTNSGVGLPNDIWVPATDKIAPQDAWQTSLGASYHFKEGAYSVQSEMFYKKMKNLVAYREGSSLFDTKVNWEDILIQGTGKSYGLELMFQKHAGKFTGWVGYTFSRTFRQFEDLNEGKAFPYRYDRIHDASVVLNYKASKRLKLSATWVYGTGIAVTVPLGYYTSGAVGGTEYIDGWNNYRLPPTHRLDIGGTWKVVSKHNNRASEINFGLYNAYNRKNPFALIRESNYGQGQFSLVSLFPVIPFVGYETSF